MSQGEDRKVLLFPRLYRKGAHLPDFLISNRRCLVCDAYGCTLKFLTPEEKGGKRTGDNLLPVCTEHALLPLKVLAYENRRVRQWLIDQERVDILVDLGLLRG